MKKHIDKSYYDINYNAHSFVSFKVPAVLGRTSRFRALAGGYVLFAFNL